MSCIVPSIVPLLLFEEHMPKSLCFNLQISQLEKKLDQLRSDKHQLFLQLKKVLNQEEETRRRAQLKEQRYC